MDININRKVWEPLWYFYFEKFNLGDNDGSYYINDTFEVHSYDWSFDSTQEYNFWHKASGYKISWYKYAMRGAEANMDITAEQFIDILIDCCNSIYKDRNMKVQEDCNKWWEKI